LKKIILFQALGFSTSITIIIQTTVAALIALLTTNITKVGTASAYNFVATLVFKDPSSTVGTLLEALVFTNFGEILVLLAALTWVVIIKAFGAEVLATEVTAKFLFGILLQLIILTIRNLAGYNLVYMSLHEMLNLEHSELGSQFWPNQHSYISIFIYFILATVSRAQNGEVLLKDANLSIVDNTILAISMATSLQLEHITTLFTQIFKAYGTDLRGYVIHLGRGNLAGLKGR